MTAITYGKEIRRLAEDKTLLHREWDVTVDGRKYKLVQAPPTAERGYAVWTLSVVLDWSTGQHGRQKLRPMHKWEDGDLRAAKRYIKNYFNEEKK